jgi:ribonuclease P protein component
VTIHILSNDTESSSDEMQEMSRTGFVVSKAVGGAVVRNRVKRRLRSIVAALNLPTGLSLVVRAAPRSAEATFDDLRLDVERLVTKAEK